MKSKTKNVLRVAQLDTAEMLSQKMACRQVKVGAGVDPYISVATKVIWTQLISLTLYSCGHI